MLIMWGPVRHLLSLLIVSKCVLLSPIAPQEYTMYQAVVEKCPNLSAPSSKALQHLLSDTYECTDWLSINRSAHLTTYTANDVRCLVLYEGLIAYCARSDAFGAPVVQLNATAGQLCDSFLQVIPALKVEHEFVKKIDSAGCQQLCYDIFTKQTLDMCVKAYFFASRAVEMDAEQQPKVDEGTGKVPKPPSSKSGILENDAKPKSADDNKPKQSSNVQNSNNAIIDNNSNTNNKIEQTSVHLDDGKVDTEGKTPIAKTVIANTEKQQKNVVQAQSAANSAISQNVNVPSSETEKSNAEAEKAKSAAPLKPIQTIESPKAVKSDKEVKNDIKNENIDNAPPGNQKLNEENAEAKPAETKTESEKSGKSKITETVEKQPAAAATNQNAAKENEQSPALTNADRQPDEDAYQKSYDDDDLDKEMVVEIEKPKKAEKVVDNHALPVDDSVVSEKLQQSMKMDGDSSFFSYFMVTCLFVVAGYVGYHNRQKIFALILEGRRGRRQSRSRRPNSANYRKLDSNLEEAISSSCSKNTSNVIY